MVFNLHTHTFRCNHATGTEEEYVKAAIERGIKTLGFSDHAPYIFEGDHYSYFRMYPQQLADYTSTVLDLRERFKDKIDIRLGVEMEYYPKYFEQTVKMLRSGGIEYMILGQHFIGNEIGEPYCGRETGDEQVLARYVDQCTEAMKTGMFTYLAHPDLLHFTGDGDIYRKHMHRLCRNMASLGAVLEINLLGIRESRHYPREDFWRIAADEGCRAILGCDAHCSDAMNDLAAEQKAMALADKVGIEIVDSVPIIKL